MQGRRLVVIGLAAGALIGGTDGHAQTAPVLRPTLAPQDTANTLTELDNPSPLPVPRLTVGPDEEQALPVRRKRKEEGDPYAPTGIRMGGITLYPSLGFGPVATSNVGKSAGKAQADLGLRLTPGLRFESDWVRHSWTGSATGNFIRYLENEDLNSQDASLSTALRLDLRRNTRIDAAASYDLTQTGIENSEVPATAIGNRTEHAVAASAALVRSYGRVEARLKGGARWQIYDDVKLSGGGSEDNSDRNYVSPSIALRATFTDPPSLKPFVEVGYDRRIHMQELDRNGLRRDSDGVTATAGVVIDRGPIWSGEVGLTYLVRDYGDPSLATNSALGLTGALTWRPTELTEIVFNLGTSLTETASATSSGGQDWIGNVNLRHDLRKNLTLLGDAGLEFEGEQAGTDVTTTAGIGLEWDLSREVAWTAAYDFTWFNSASGTQDYTEHRVTTGLLLRR